MTKTIHLTKDQQFQAKTEMYEYRSTAGGYLHDRWIDDLTMTVDTIKIDDDGNILISGVCHYEDDFGRPRWFPRKTAEASPLDSQDSEVRRHIRNALKRAAAS